jgi:hypothetical protein
VRVWRAAETKSYVFIRVSRGGFVSGEKDAGMLGGGLAHSVVMELGSREPRIFDEGRDVRIKEGAWISLYAVDASRPA